MPHRPKVIMIGPFPKNKIYGGISNGVSVTLASNIVDEYNIKYIATSCRGNGLQKIMAMAAGLSKLFTYLVFTNIKILHIKSASWLSFYRKMVYVFMGKVFRKKVILQIHGGEFNVFYDWGPNINRWIITKVLDSVSLILVLSERKANDIKAKTKNNNIKILFNPVNTSSFSLHSNKTKKSKETNNVIFMGKLCKQKGIYDLLQAIPLILKKEPSAIFILCGDGEIDNYRRICEKKGIADRVRFLGWISGQNKINKICNADVFVLPSYIEGLPNAIIEAMSAGLPIVSTRVGGIPDIIQDGINGFLIQPGDVQAIGDRIVKLLQDRSLKQKMGERNAMEAKNKFDVNVVIKQLCQIYHELLALD